MNGENQAYDLAVVGGGLAGGLVAMALAHSQPNLRIVLIEAGKTLGGNHVWSFFDSDVDDDARALLAPLVSRRWAGTHEVRFPAHARRLAGAYNSIRSCDFDRILRDLLSGRVLTGTPVAMLRPDGVTLADGREITASAVLDARGFSGPGDPLLRAIDCGWQTFVGQELRLSAPHGQTGPTIMDATVEQIGGYRFVYVLPGEGMSLFVEDTYYADTADIDAAALRARIADYAAARGWTVEAIAHEEQGALAVVHGGRFDAFWPLDDPVARAGVRAGLFHATTGYSLPFSARFALALAREAPMDGMALARWSRERAKRHWRAQGYYRMLGKMLFRAAPPLERYRVFERFYRLPEPLIARFYAGQSTRADKLRILCGRPPVPIRAAIRALVPNP